MKRSVGHARRMCRGRCLLTGFCEIAFRCAGRRDRAVRSRRNLRIENFRIIRGRSGVAAAAPQSTSHISPPGRPRTISAKPISTDMARAAAADTPKPARTTTIAASRRPQPASDTGAEWDQADRRHDNKPGYQGERDAEAVADQLEGENGETHREDPKPEHSGASSGVSDKSLGSTRQIGRARRARAGASAEPAGNGINGSASQARQCDAQYRDECLPARPDRAARGATLASSPHRLQPLR